MIEPDPLEVAAWRMAAGELRSEELPGLATDALVRGIDSPALRILAGQAPSDVRESADLFRRAVNELDVNVPDAEQARWHLVRMTAQHIVDGRINPAAGASDIWMMGYLHVEDSGDLRIFVGLASMLDDHPEDRVHIEAQIVEAARELLGRPQPRRWIKLMAVVGRSPLTRTAGADDTAVDPTDLPIPAGLISELERWADEHRSLLSQWPDSGGFESEEHAREFVARGERLVAQLQAELGPGYHVEYMPEPILPPGVKLARG